MSIRAITKDQKKLYDTVVNHPLQTYEWGEFREKTGTKVIRKGIFEKDKIVGGFQLTIHRIPHTPWCIGYFPRGERPQREIIDELKIIGQKENCIFIQLEPNVRSTSDSTKTLTALGLIPAAHPLFTKFTFILDLTQSEEVLLKNMHHKTRYNIRVAQKHNVEIIEDNSEKAFSMYWQLTEETTKRQKFYAHTKKYHKLQWDFLNVSHNKDNALTSHLFVAKYNDEVLAAWILFVCGNTLYYPYGASSTAHREVMASNLLMWEAIRFGKNKGLKKFDMWGALGPNPDPTDSWYGFHTFKQKYGTELVEFVGSYDLVIHPFLYQSYKITDKIRWKILRIIK
jgi:lipid II:glycine glycyltransferase (peptidoglycan interpeptide bridge formation enzyme)